MPQTNIQIPLGWAFSHSAHTTTRMHVQIEYKEYFAIYNSIESFSTTFLDALYFHNIFLTPKIYSLVFLGHCVVPCSLNFSIYILPSFCRVTLFIEWLLHYQTLQSFALPYWTIGYVWFFSIYHKIIKVDVHRAIINSSHHAGSQCTDQQMLFLSALAHTSQFGGHCTLLHRIPVCLIIQFPSFSSPLLQSPLCFPWHNCLYFATL